MKKALFTFILAILTFTMASTELPRIDKGTLIVDGEPFVMLAGELHNSSTGSAEYMEPIWPRMARKNLNTVLAVVSWEMIEPQEGEYDFTLVDKMIEGARANGLRLGILWFGSWKNGVSTYVPGWVKTDSKRFPLAEFSDGSKMQCLSTLGKESARADARAFGTLMRHLAEVDRQHTVVIVQVENEIGTLDSLSAFSGTPNRAQRDYSAMATKAFKGQVPTELTTYLSANFKSLHPAIAEAWAENGKRMTGSWEDVFGKGKPSTGTAQWADEYPYLTEEIFMAWNYGKYVEQVTSAGKNELALPMYVNSWLKQEGGREPGRYPSGAALPHLYDIWRAAAPSVDFFAPDIYTVDNFVNVCAEYVRDGNPLFIPETTADAGGAARAFYAFGRHDALGYAPFGIDGHGLMLSAQDEDTSYERAYGVLKHILPLREGHRSYGLLTDASRPEDAVECGDYRISIGPFSSERAFAVAGVVAKDTPKEAPTTAALMVIELSKGEFIFAGMGDQMVGINKSSTSRADNIGLLEVDELTFTPEGRTISRRLNGDETALGGVVIPDGEARAYSVKMYEY